MNRLAPVAFLATGACFATQNDIRILQNDIQVLQAEQASARAAADSARAAEARRNAEFRAVIDQVVASLKSLGDSLNAANRRMTSFQGQVRGDLYNLGQQVLAVQTLTGQSAERLREFRLQIERTNQPPPEEPAAGAGRSASPPATGGAPGPEQLFEIGRQQINRQSWSTARTAFSDLLSQYPTAVNASDAQYQIALTYEGEKNQPAADSVFAIVVAKYPRSPIAPEALYKHALSLKAQNRTAEARPLIARLRRDYPTSTSATLSRETFPPPQ